MRFILTRHCETGWNAEGRLQGWTDISLNGKGREQAARLAEALLAYDTPLIVSSDLSRAVETAEIIQARYGDIPMVQDDRLRESGMGSLEGMLRDEAIATSGLSSSELSSATDYDYRPFGGEDCTGVVARHLEVLNEYAAKHPDKPILIVGHGNGLNALLAHLGHEAELEREQIRIIEYS